MKERKDPSRVTRAPSLGNLLFCFHNLHRRRETGWKKKVERRRTHGGDAGKNGVKILDHIAIVKSCPKSLR